VNIFIAVLVLLPVVLLAAAAIAAVVSVRRSSLRITEAGITFRNYPQPNRTIPLDQVARFEAPVLTGNFPSVRPTTGVLVLTDGSRFAVRSLSDPEAGVGIQALNARVESLRRGS
jgi:hypothetical protein